VSPGGHRQWIRVVASGSVDLMLDWRTCGGLDIGGESWGLAPVGAATKHWRPSLGARSEWSDVVGAGGDVGLVGVWSSQCCCSG
jgi:hypothetical protein